MDETQKIIAQKAEQKQREKAEFFANKPRIGNKEDPGEIFEKLFEKPKIIKDKKGNEHKLPDLDFDKEWELIYKIKKLIGKLEGRSWETILDEILDLSDGKERILEIAGILLGKDNTFIRLNFNLSGLVGLLLPFLAPIVLGKNIKSLAPLIHSIAKDQSIS